MALNLESLFIMVTQIHGSKWYRIYYLRIFSTSCFFALCPDRCLIVVVRES